MSKSHPRWRLAKKILTWLFFIAVIVLLVVYAKKVDWEEVWKVIRDYNRVALLSAVGLVVVSYLIYGCYDLLARFLLRSQTGEAPGDAGVVYLLRLQPDA
ncbi:inner membrane protein [Escherichia coli]|nr:inner membrane protein [Escherichia coli]